MKKTIIAIVMYLLGVFLSYVYLKSVIIREGERKIWTVGDRVACIGFSLASWLTVAAAGLVDLTTTAANNKTPANW